MADKEKLPEKCSNYSYNPNAINFTGHYDCKECPFDKKNEWINIKDQEPELGKIILAYTQDNNMRLCYLEAITISLKGKGHIWIQYPEYYRYRISLTNITHWMPLPGKPVIEKENENE